jgi:hypothetical protein
MLMTATTLLTIRTLKSMTVARKHKSTPSKTLPVRSKLTRPQGAIYCEGWKPNAQFRVACCGRRFGKSFLAVEEIRRAVRLAVKLGISTDDEIWYAAPTFKLAKANFWRRLKRGIPQSWMASKPNESACSILLKSGHMIRCVGLDNYDNLRGAGLWFVVVDEAADVKFAAWDETLEPMLATSDGHALFIGTPKGFGWFYDFHCKGMSGTQAESGFLSFTYTTAQGGNVSQKKLDRARREKDPRTFRQEYEASFESYEGRVIYAFSRAKHVRPCAYDPSLPVEIGMDFNVNPMTAVIIQPHGKEDWQIGEIVIPTSNTNDMATEIRRKFGRGGNVGHITVYPDPAGAQRRTSAQGKTDISILREEGFRVVAMSSHPLVRDRVNVTNGRFEAADGTESLFVDPSCSKSIECYERLVYKEGTSDPDKSTGHDHGVDALGYWAYTRFAYKPPVTTRVNMMGR